MGLRTREYLAELYDSDNDGTSDAQPFTAYSYYPNGQLQSVTDPRGNSGIHTNSRSNYTSTYEYDRLGRLLCITLPGDPSTGVISDDIDFTYYDDGSLYKRIEADGGITTYTYTPRGDVASVEISGGSSPSYLAENRYDDVRNLIRTIAPDETVTLYTYDDWNRLIEVEYPEGNGESYKYDAYDNLITLTDGLGRKTENTYDVLGRLLKTERPDETAYTYQYDRLGSLTRTTDPDGRELTWEYDERGLPIQESDVGRSLTTSYSYDLAGNLVGKTDPNGTEGVFVYNADNLPLTITLTGTNAASQVYTYQYDEAGSLMSADLDGILSAYNVDATSGEYLPDPYGLINREQTSFTSFLGDAKEYSVSYDYDALGRMIGITGPRGITRDYDYNEIGQLETVDRFIEQDINYDDAGRLESATLANGITIDWDYDRNGRLMSKSYDGSNSIASVAHVAHWAFEYDDANNILTKNDIIYTYDALNQLTSESRQTINQSLIQSQSVQYAEGDLPGETVVYQASTESIALDYNASSLLVQFSVAQNIRRIHLHPASRSTIGWPKKDCRFPTVRAKVI